MKKIIPKVDETQEFIEIAFDFSNSLDLVREAISNSFDAEATEIKIGFNTIVDSGDKLLEILLEDNGNGMNFEELQSFFDLGNSLRRGYEDKIGEKGHGTKVYLNCNRIIVETQKDKKKYTAIMDQPKRKLFNREKPEAEVTIEEVDSNESYTKITVLGYNNNTRDEFTHERVKDYILWFTKMGSVEKEFGLEQNKDVVLYLKGLDRKEYEEISFGHVFPEESESVNKLIDIYDIDAPNYFCKKIIKKGHLKDSPEIDYEAVFYIEGLKLKYQYNNMIRRSGYSAPDGAYKVADRYGLWICKDYMPVQRKNEWITKKGNEHTRLHAFINCQGISLTANRGSIENTPIDIINDLRNVAEDIYDEIVSSDEWLDLDFLNSEVDSVNTRRREEKEFKKRIELTNAARICDYEGVRLVEPHQEQGVYSLYLQLSSISEDLFPFTIIDYDTHSGIDVIVKSKDNNTIKNSKLYYVEFKNILEQNFNHSFANLYSIVCWDINLKNGDEIKDLAGEKRILKIIPPEDDNGYTKYYLDNSRSERKIEVFVLKSYLNDKLGIEFRSRTEDDCY